MEKTQRGALFFSCLNLILHYSQTHSQTLLAIWNLLKDDFFITSANHDETHVFSALKFLAETKLFFLKRLRICLKNLDNNTFKEMAVI